ncbi:5-(carboxyamino)imidazole ribonucleotide synthase [Hyphomonas sp.]|uniref:5-(carboxyamino)imidazole ribonucleotide synthase n=1 Tax=Hyphomonas sp. TaxID=87 RepID=UPI00391D2645
MTPLPPGATIGILGGGQLGRMLAGAAAQLGFDVLIYSPEDDPPAGRVAAGAFQADWDDAEALREFAAACDVITLEFENVPVESVRIIEVAGKRVLPGAASLSVSQDRLAEKTFLNQHGIATAPFHRIDAAGDIAPALASLGTAGVLKTRRDGYDGKGQAWVRSPQGAEAAWAAIGAAPAILEGAIAFDCEISVLVARGQDGTTTSWAPPRNTHKDGILDRSVVPSGLPKGVEEEARRKAMHLAEALGHVGVLALEFFVLPDGTLLANEFAPRVHNSGHCTPEACKTGQFEQHIRCVAGWPLGDTYRLFDAEMINLIGEAGHVDPAKLGPEDVLTLYGKREARPGRKMGHITRRLAPRKD